jgi:YD repeat-containing protein
LAANGDLTSSTVSGISAVTSYTYDVLGNLTSTTDPRSFVTEYLYDLNRRRTHPQLAHLLADDAESLCTVCTGNNSFHSARDRDSQPRCSCEGRAAKTPPLKISIIQLARLGGYLNRTRDAPPGNTVVWRGMSRLTDIELGYLMGAEVVGN